MFGYGERGVTLQSRIWLPTRAYIAFGGLEVDPSFGSWFRV